MNKSIQREIIALRFEPADEEADKRAQMTFQNICFELAKDGVTKLPCQCQQCRTFAYSTAVQHVMGDLRRRHLFN